MQKYDNKGVILVRVNDPTGLRASQLEVVNLSTNEKIVLTDALINLNRNKLQLFKLPVGQYKLSRYRFHSYASLDISSSDFSFYVKENVVNYVGDWHFEQKWKNAQAKSVSYEVRYSGETLQEFRSQYEQYLDSWKVESFIE
ncbi:hypothetical protein [Aliikangiella sp. G2MR2-5]|uniref:hypothetical protein n=1 Tax=Aliikangiella sp. G2MR2-5 TaxID=2788943 RepID=UPI0018AADC65|nr:hypothetical protein [Aliikangiella sp. G2MR2-5]